MPNSEAIVSEVAPVEMSNIELTKIELNNRKFVDQARTIHGDNYNYSKSIYKTLKAKLVIVCPEHGEFQQSPKEHLSGKGCRKCGYKKCSETTTGSKQQRRLVPIDGKLIRNTTDQFIEGAKIVHGGKYDYSKTVYVLTRVKVVIICKEHGEFTQRPNSHLQGAGCPDCGIRKSYLASMPKFRSSKKKLNAIEHFLVRASAAHGDTYDYSQTEYTGCMNKVKIICRTHGEFTQSPASHMLGYGCPECGKILQSEAMKTRWAKVNAAKK